MICIECRNDSCKYCRNYYNVAGEKRNPPTKTWCDCQHRDGVILMAKDCHHYRRTDNYCPTCGTDFHGESNSESQPSSQAIADATGIGNEAANVEGVEEYDANAVTSNPNSPNITLEKLQAKRRSLPGRKKETPSS